MMREQKPLYFDPSRVDLDSTEELTIGAFARRQWQRQIAIGLVGVLLIAASLFIYVMLRPAPKPNSDTTYPVRRQCVSCGYQDTLRVAYDQTFPMKCPKCGEMAVQALWQCQGCQKTFVPEQRGSRVVCPFCGSDHVGSAIQSESLPVKP
jgi:predicted RNA-binding Zn-ribbon protein involved in translation (DUF1610 family)